MVVVEVASFDHGYVVVGYICDYGIVVGYICGCGWREKETGRKKREEYFLLFYYVVNIILLNCKNKNWDVGWVVKWVGIINEMVFEDVK